MHSNPNKTVTLALTNILLEVYDKCVYLRFLFEKNDQNFERFELLAIGQVSIQNGF